ncbi:hypothetical protein FRC07_001838, partial [Ceratobasidium sp. 392]
MTNNPVLPPSLAPHPTNVISAGNTQCNPLHEDWLNNTAILADPTSQPPAPGEISSLHDSSGSEVEDISEGESDDEYVSQHEQENADKGGRDNQSEREGQNNDPGENEARPGDGNDPDDETDSEHSSTTESEEDDSDDSTVSDGEWDHMLAHQDDDMEMDQPYELPNPGNPSASHSDDSNLNNEVELEELVDEHGNRVFIERYPNPLAGEPIHREAPPRRQYRDVGELMNNEAFKIAHLLMVSGMSARNRNSYLRLKRIRAIMPWDTNRAMMQDIDKLPHGPEWKVKAIEITGDVGVEVAEYWCRNALECLKQILQDKQLGPHIRFKVYRKWTSRDKNERIHDELFTADWNWDTQEEIDKADPNATVISLIISSDETKVTTFSGDKKAHPVYLTIGNLPKHLRRRISKRANILIGYLPVPKLDCISGKEKRRITRRKLFHHCMKTILQPLEDACKQGVEILCADGGVKPTERGDLKNSPPRETKEIIEAIETHRLTGSATYLRLGLFNVIPFWSDYPHVKPGSFLTPDLLHQLHKGVMKDHLTKWVTHIISEATVNERHKSMPEHHGMRHFKNGISAVSQWTGRELKEMAKVLLPVASDAKDPAVMSAARALLDFMYLSHSSSLSDKELEGMENALRTFHQHKDVFKRAGAVKTKKAFHGIPKIHMIQHYVELIRQLGTPDGYNTETAERLHIDFAKMGYRASNKVNATKQMALYIQRMEAIAMHATYLEERERVAPDNPQRRNDRLEEEMDDEEWDAWYDEEEEQDALDEIDEAAVREEVAIKLDDFIAGRPMPGNGGGRWEAKQPQEDVDMTDDPQDDWPLIFHPVPELVIAKTPTTANVSLAHLHNKHGATKILPALLSFLKRDTGRTAAQLRIELAGVTTLNIWSRARLIHAPPPFKPFEGPSLDVVRAWPEKFDRYERVSRPARFDTVLVLMDNSASGIHRYRVGRVRVIFEIPQRRERGLYDGKLAYVEMFNVASRQPVEPAGLFTVTRSVQDGSRICIVVPLSQIRMTCHLAPQYNSFHPEEPLTLHSD